MPELPEVETACRGIAPYLTQQKFVQVIVRQRQLRWPIPKNLAKTLVNQQVLSVKRRAKYILITCNAGTLIIHLGMSGKLSIVSSTTPAAKHDHVDFLLSNAYIMRYTDPRRFGSILWTTQDPSQHKLLLHLGIEPLEKKLTAQYLMQMAEHKKVPIKTFLMDASIVVGIGNIYANEALFAAGILPMRAAQTINWQEANTLVKQIRRILRQAINRGGTTLQDFLHVDGQPGYFVQNLMVYGRAKQLCYKCRTKLSEIRLNQRATVYCSLCQQ